MKKLILMILLYSNFIKADQYLVNSSHDELVHDAAHFGSAYAISMISYGFYRKVFDMPPITAFIFSAVLTTAIGMTYKYVEGTGPVTGLGSAVLWNSAGIAATGLTIKLFDF